MTASIGAMLTLAGCGLFDLAGGQLELINGQRRLDRALAEETDRERRALLAEVPHVRRFAEEVVGMQPGRSYRGYFATEREGMTYVVSASERARLIAYAWWFPVAGRVEYRSYFEKADAEAAAAELQDRGYDTWISASRAYSTLGFFRDPVSTTMMRQGLTGFVEVLLHEMAHARLYVPGHTAWNEALATLVGQEAALRYFERPRFSAAPWATLMRLHIANKAARDALVADTAVQLERIYDSALPEAQKLAEKQRVFAALKVSGARLWPEDPRGIPTNNAQLLHALRYGANRRELRALWDRAGGDFRAFWRAAEQQAETLD